MKSVVAVLALSLLSCYTAPKRHSGWSNVRAFHVPFDETWSAAVDFMSSTGISIDAVEKESGLISAGRVGALASDCDCGSGFTVLITERVAKVNLLIRKTDSTLTTVRVDCSFSGWNDTNIGGRRWIPCASTGEMEQRVLNRIAERL